MLKLNNKINIQIAALTVFILSLAVGCVPSVKKSYTEEELGLRKSTLYNEDSVKPSEGFFPTEGPGTGKTVERAFDNSPPVIPHDTANMLPITSAENACVECHMPVTAKDVGATPIPKTHLTDTRTGKDLKGKLSGSRYNCTQCHVTQAKIPPLVKNSFKGGFRNKEGKSSSNLIKTLNEGL